MTKDESDKLIDIVVELLGMMLNSCTSNEDHSDHEHNLFDNVDRDNLEKLTGQLEDLKHQDV